METEASVLSPSQAAVLDIYQRLHRVGLSHTCTHDVVAAHGQMNRSKAMSVAKELVELGMLSKGTGARTTRSLVLTDAGRAYEPPAISQAG